MEDTAEVTDDDEQDLEYLVADEILDFLGPPANRTSSVAYLILADRIVDLCKRHLAVETS